jgi:hypothetical protein
MERESLVERRYQEALNQMTGLEKMQRVASLRRSGWEMIALQVKQEIGKEISERELRYRVAQRMNESDPAFLGLLQQCYEHG